MIRSGEKTLLAISGGIDSMVMLDLFHRSGLPFSVCHCNFQLRGKNSDLDEVFVQSWAKEFNAQCFIKHFDTMSYAKQHGISIQMAARELRYGWFDELLSEHALSKVATAHHWNDSVETIIFNLAKGTGIRGLLGIAPKKDRLIRPLINFKRERIEKYACERNIKWREDSSNASDKYHRNYIRHQVIPSLERINPDLLETMKTVRSRLSDTEAVFNQEAQNFKAKYYSSQSGVIRILKKGLQIPGITTILEMILRPAGFNRSQVERIISTSAKVGSQFFSKDYHLVVDREYLLICRLNEPLLEVEVNDSLGVVDYGSDRLLFSREKDHPVVQDSGLALLDSDRLIFPLKIRSWRQGDTFIPLGMKGKKKLSDFMIDIKIPLNLKNQVPILVNGNGDIVWIVGYRMDDRYKITSSTKHLIKVQLHESFQEII